MFAVIGFYIANDKQFSREIECSSIVRALSWAAQEQVVRLEIWKNGKLFGWTEPGETGARDWYNSLLAGIR